MMTKRIDKLNFSLMNSLSHCKERFDILKVETYITKKITNEHLYSSVKPFLLLKLTTKCGIEGWGEAFVSDGSEILINRLIHDNLTKKLSFRKINPVIFINKLAYKDDNYDLMCATSAIEIALWDILGKYTNKSVSELLQTNNSKSVPVYANTWSDIKQDDNNLIANVEEQLNKNYDSIKVYPLQNRVLGEAASIIREVRKVVGPARNIMIDLECPKDSDIPYNLENEILDTNPYWYEEPFDGKNLLKLSEYKKISKLKIVTGERQSEINHFKSLCHHKATDIINPDISAIGGIIRMLNVATIAANGGILVSPHCWNTMTISASAMMHVCRIINNNEKAELFPEYFSFGDIFSIPGFKIRNSVAILQNRPGLGVIMDETELKKLSGDYRITLL
tara:strand:- start:35 stop:1213 length:1179 start_codon:yes stop_codon:yes gene_type:complete